MPRTRTINDWLDQVGEGWRELIRPLVEVCLEHGGQIAQIKEKFGGLRFYYDKPKPSDEMTPQERAFWKVFDEAVRGVEARSYSICEFTGQMGRLCSQGLDGKARWMKTLSPAKAEELGYVYPDSNREF